MRLAWFRSGKYVYLPQEKQICERVVTGNKFSWAISSNWLLKNIVYPWCLLPAGDQLPSNSPSRCRYVMIKILHLDSHSFSFCSNRPHGLEYKTDSDSNSCSRSLCIRYTFWHCANLVFEILLWYSETYHKVNQVYHWTGLFWPHFSSLHSS